MFPPPLHCFLTSWTVSAPSPPLQPTVSKVTFNYFSIWKVFTGAVVQLVLDSTSAEIYHSKMYSVDTTWGLSQALQPCLSSLCIAVGFTNSENIPFTSMCKHGRTQSFYPWAGQPPNLPSKYQASVNIYHIKAYNKLKHRWFCRPLRSCMFFSLYKGTERQADVKGFFNREILKGLAKTWEESTSRQKYSHK